ncbi:(2Fe-2S)-binding protein [Microvirga sp. GCM10011540]|uniref:(2Fe-2S)-binding protein n=1 Tax=Microvirga sp. GCM10011540 TaxID=3317338 RepID=UPI00360D5899
MSEKLELHVNGRSVLVAVEDPDTPLLYVLRNTLELKGARFGCGLEQCGACTVLVDGEPVFACNRAVSTVVGREIVTVEGLSPGEDEHPLQQAFIAEQAGQCGYCLTGILVSASALLKNNPDPSRDEIVSALDRHLCRCGAHNRIIRAVQRAASIMREGK